LEVRTELGKTDSKRQKSEENSETSITSEILIGTSGWSYKEWEGVFYPDSKTPKLTYYSGIFSTAEIDSTFYANPSRGMVLGWTRNTPKSFQFAMKLPQLITHKKQLDLDKGAEIDLREFIDLINPVHEAGKLGPLLIQLPPSFGLGKRTTLEEFFKVLPSDYLFAVEFRNKSWLKDRDLDSLLRQYRVASTIVDEPLLPVNLTTTSSDFAFVRWHGRGTRPWYDYRYGEEEIEPWVENIKTISRKVKKIYGYYNNHFHGYAVENSLELMQKLKIASEEQEITLRKVRSRIEGGQSADDDLETDRSIKANKKEKKATESLDPDQKSLIEF